MGSPGARTRPFSQSWRASSGRPALKAAVARRTMSSAVFLLMPGTLEQRNRSARKAGRDPGRLVSSFRGARSASPESITTTGGMDSGPAPSGASRNDEVNYPEAGSVSRHYPEAARPPVNNGDSGDIFRCVLENRTRSWLNQSSYGDGRSSRRFGPQFATAPICSGTRSGYGWEIGPRRRGPEIARQCGAAVGQERPSGRPGGLFLVRLSLRRRARLARSGRLPRYSAAKEIVDRS